MRWARFALAPVASLGTAVVCALASAGWVRGAGEGDLLFRVASPGKLAMWIVAGAYRVPLTVRSNVSTRSGFLNRFFEDRIGFEATLLVVPMTVTVLACVAGALVARRAASSRTDVLTGAGLAGAVQAIALPVLLSGASGGIGFSGRIVQAGVEVFPRRDLAVLMGFLFGAGCVLAANVDVLAGRRLARSWRWALIAGACVGAAGLLAVGGGGRPDVPAPGVALLAVNALAAALVVSHGPSLSLELFAGPLSDQTRLDYAHAPSSAFWLFVLVPVAAGIAAGRTRDTGGSAVRHAAGFALVWALTLAALAALLRVELFSDFSLASLARSATGGVRVSPVVAALLGAVVAFPIALAAGLTVRAPAQAAVAGAGPSPAIPAWTCPRCRAVNAEGARFCASCGHQGWT